MRLIEAAVHDAGIVHSVVGGGRGADCCARWCRRGGRGRNRSLLRATLSFRGRRLLLGIWLGLAVGDEFRVAGGARPRRHIGRHAAGPMRPMIGDKAATAREIKPKSEQTCRSNEPLEGHKGCRMSRARNYYSDPPGWIAFVAVLWC